MVSIGHWKQVKCVGGGDLTWEDFSSFKNTNGKYTIRLHNKSSTFYIVHFESLFNDDIVWNKLSKVMQLRGLKTLHLNGHPSS